MPHMMCEIVSWYENTKNNSSKIEAIFIHEAIKKTHMTYFPP